MSHGVVYSRCTKVYKLVRTRGRRSEIVPTPKDRKDYG